VANLRVRTPADVPALAEVLRRVREADDYPTVWPDDVDGWITGNGNYGAWVAVHDENLAGQVGLTRPGAKAGTQRWAEATQRGSERLAEVTRLFVDPDVRGLGIGRQLLQRAVEGAHELGLWPVLDVRHDGRPGASRLYEAAGWRLIDSAPRRLAPEVVRPFHCWIGPPPPA
jgi:GNAT superfamily N-acetyltransferase